MFDREENVGTKRKIKTNVQDCSATICYDNIQLHMKKHHTVKFGQYEKLRSKAEHEYFLMTSSIHFVFEATSNREIVFIIDKVIVEVIVSELMYSAEGETNDVDDDDKQELAFGREAECAIVGANCRVNDVKAMERAMSLFKHEIGSR